MMNSPSETTRTKHKTILHLVNQTNFGGMQQYIISLAEHQVQKGSQVVVGAGEIEIDQSFVDAVNDANATFIHLSHIREYINEWGHNIASLVELHRLIKRIKPDVIHTHSIKLNLLVGLVNWKRIPHIHTVHILWIHSFPKTIKQLFHYTIEWFGLRYCSAIITVCKYDQLVWRRIKLLTRSRSTTIIINVLNPKKVNTQITRAELETLLPHAIPTSATLIGCVGHINAVKRHSDIIQALSILKRQDVFLIIMGNGPLRNELELQTAKCKLQHQVLFTGAIPGAARYMNVFDLFVLPSEQESLPYVLLEASATGVPIVATNVGGIPEIKQSNWVLVPPRDPATLAKAIEKGLTLPRLESKSLEQLQNEYDDFLNKTDGVYEGVLKRSS